MANIGGHLGLDCHRSRKAYSDEGHFSAFKSFRCLSQSHHAHRYELWTRIRHALFVDKNFKREAYRRFGLNYRIIDKISPNERPGNYVREKAPITKLTPYLPIIEGYLA